MCCNYVTGLIGLYRFQFVVSTQAAINSHVMKLMLWAGPDRYVLVREAYGYYTTFRAVGVGPNWSGHGRTSL